LSYFRIDFKKIKTKDMPELNLSLSAIEGKEKLTIKTNY
jgi:hypothetical protein